MAQTEELYTVSDSLFALRRRLTDFLHEPRVLEPDDARAMSEELKPLSLQVNRLGHEVSRTMWNAAARRENPVEEQRTRALILQAAQDGKVAFLHHERPFS